MLSTTVCELNIRLPCRCVETFLQTQQSVGTARNKLKAQPKVRVASTAKGGKKPAAASDDDEGSDPAEVITIDGDDDDDEVRRLASSPRRFVFTLPISAHGPHHASSSNASALCSRAGCKAGHGE